MLGFIEFLSLLMAMSGASVQADPKAPSADVVMRYAPESADLMVHLDVTAVVPGLYQALSDLPTSPAVKNDPDLSREVTDVLKEVEAGRGMVKGLAGIDLTTDVTSVTAWLTLSPAAPPAGLVVVRGAVSGVLLDRIAKMAGGKIEEIDGRKSLSLPELGVRVGVSKDGDLIGGSDALVKARIASDWKPAKRAKGSVAARVAKMIDGKPFLLAVTTPSADAVRLATSALGGDNFVSDLVSGHSLAAIALHATGIGWTWIGNSKESYQRATLFSEGAIDLMRAGVVAPRGMIRIAAAALESYAGKSKELDALIKNKDLLLSVVGDMTGDGNFAVKWDKDAGKFTVAVRATGKRFSEVVPVAALGAAVGAGLVFRKGEMRKPVMRAAGAKAAGGTGRRSAIKRADKPAKPAVKAAKPATKK